MSDTERQRRLKAISKILSKTEIPDRLRRDLEGARASLFACVAFQTRAARLWRIAANRALRRKAY